MKYVCLITAFLLSVGICQAQQDDHFPELTYLSKFCAKFPPDEKPNVLADTNLIAIWKMQEDVDSHNYFVVERYSLYEYVYTYMNREGSNRTYENFSAYFSKIKDVTFLVMPLYDRKTSSMGYFFLKVTDLDNRGWNMTLSLVKDTTLKNITSRKALRERIEKNMNNPDFYEKPVHFHKILPLMYCK